MWFFGSNRAWRLFLLEPHVLSLPFFLYIHMPKIGGGGNVCRFQVVVTMMMWFLSGW